MGYLLYSLPIIPSNSGGRLVAVPEVYGPVSLQHIIDKNSRNSQGMTCFADKLFKFWNTMRVRKSREVPTSGTDILFARQVI